MTTRHFCSYFDHRYLPRGLAMIASIRKYCTDTQFYILALDIKCGDMLDALAIDGVEVVSIGELESFDPELRAARQGRSLIEYYFTCTPCFPRYLLETRPVIDLITYIDADACFMASPEIVFAEIGSASVAITPHRFSPERVEMIQYGRFNVGWVSWRNDEIGRRCLEDYRSDCIDWCFDYVDGQRFADQKYLDKWPFAYPNVYVIDNPGVNVAPWNLNHFTLTKQGDTVMLSGRLLVFWHHSALKEIDGSWYPMGLDAQMTERHSLLMDSVAVPYIMQLNALRADLEARFGKYRTPGDEIRYSADRPRADEKSLAVESSVSSSISDRDRAASTGYRLVTETEARAILDEGWLFDDVAENQARAFDGLVARMKAGQPRLDLSLAAEAIKALDIANPSVLEVGCGSGYYSEVFSFLIPGGVRYTGLDYSDAMIALARRRYPGEIFRVGNAATLPFPDNAFDVVLNGVSLMHILDFEAAIQESARVAARYVIIHTAVLRQAGPPIHLVKDAYGRPVVEIIISETELRRLFAKYGLAVIAVAASIPYDLQPVLGEPTYTRTYLCKVDEQAGRQHPLLLNLGCGGHFHLDWVNLDLTSAHPNVMAFNVLAGLPYASGSFDAVYHSHMLEHLPVWQAPGFMAECARVLRPGGVLRVAIPDLETICRLYLENLEGAATGDSEAEGRYDWMLMELLDQMVRAESGGEMARFWLREIMPAEDFVIGRIGVIVESVRRRVREEGLRPAMGPRVEPSVEETARFRRQGEVHQWMYDRFSLARLMRQVGLSQIAAVRATESAIPDFARFELDVDANGCVRKPDSLFMEARRG